ncbi:MAG: hypothetical protein ABI351_05280 [Herbaspirillum sp.]
MNDYHRGIWISVLALLAGCSSTPPVADWQANTHAALQRYNAAYLSGDTRAAEQEFLRARSESSRTGRADVVAQVELSRCATQVASLDFDACPGFTALAADATEAQRSYAAYLDGRWQDLDIKLLPPQQREMLARLQLDSRLTGITEPLSRLVAAGALFKSGQLHLADVAVAVDTASAAGWRRPLLAWLGVQEKLAHQAGDSVTVARVQRRIDLVAKPDAGPETKSDAKRAD